jgi:hypothetical protein
MFCSGWDTRDARSWRESARGREYVPLRRREWGWLCGRGDGGCVQRRLTIWKSLLGDGLQRRIPRPKSIYGAERMGPLELETTSRPDAEDSLIGQSQPASVCRLHAIIAIIAIIALRTTSCLPRRLTSNRPKRVLSSSHSNPHEGCVCLSG